MEIFLLIKHILVVFLFGWVISEWANKLALYTSNLKLTRYICQKCITFWSGLILCYMIGLPIIDIFLVAASASFLASIYMNIIYN